MRSKYFIFMVSILCVFSLAASAGVKATDEILVAIPTNGQDKLPVLVKERINTQITDGISDWEAALMAGAYYLRDMQADVDTLATTPDNANNGWDFDATESPDDPDDAGWDWRVTSPPAPFSHTTAASSVNLYGPICLGIYDAYIYDGSSDASLYRVMEDAADLLVTDTSTYAYAGNITFLLRFSILSGDSSYATAAQAMWDGKFVSGGGTHADATAYAEAIRDGRAGQGYENGIIPWDIAGYVMAAQDLHGAFPGNGYDLDADDMAEVVYDDVYNDLPGYFDLEDDKYNYWYNLGVVGVIDCFKIADVHTTELPALLDLLLESQDPSGAFTYYYQYSVTWQTTAYAIQALARFGSDYRQQMGMACEWLALTQDSSGGFVYSNGNHYPEICGENVSGLVRNGASSSDITGYTGSNAYMVVHNNSLWFEMKGSRHDADNDWALFGVPCDGSQFSINVPEYGNVWNTPWDPTSVHNFSDWEKYGFQLHFGPDVAPSNLANVWRREDSDPESTIEENAEWVLSYYSTGQCPPDDPYNELDSTDSIWNGGTMVHSILYGSVENLGVDVTGSLGCSGSSVRFTGRLVNDADESPDERFEYFGFGNHPSEASVDGDHIAKSDVIGYDFDFTVEWSHNVSGDYYYAFPADTGVTLDAVTATPDSLALTVTSGTCINTLANPTPITVELEQYLLTEPVRGYQAFTLFDDTLLTFTGGTYTSVPFGLPVITPIAAAGDAIDISAGINDFAGQLPTEDDALLATLTFDAYGTATGDTFAFTFDYDRDPPSRFTGLTGNDVPPYLQESVTVTVDNDNPVITCPADVTVDNDTGLCSATLCVGTATATDVGCGVASIVGTRSDSLPLVDPYPAGCPGVTTITWVATDYAGNTDSCVQTISVTDAEYPVITGCPTDITVYADAGLCTAEVDWIEPLAADNCGIATFTPNIAPPHVFPLGDTTVTYTATDLCGNITTCSFIVTVEAFSEMLVDLSLDGSPVTPLDRCITFELFDCGGGTSVEVTEVITFTSGSVTDAVVLVPCGAYSCITARDALHTLARTVDPLVDAGTQYDASFSQPLLGGNLNDDTWVDILDFGLLSYLWGTTTAVTDCSTAAPHADINGDGLVNSSDFSYIQINFLLTHDPACCSGPAPLGGSQPVTSVSVQDLIARGLSELAAGDLNNDGWLDQQDIVAFMQGARPGQVGVGGVVKPGLQQQK